MSAERTVLHVLPHPGGGGEAYLDTLERMPGYRSTRTYLALGRTPSDAFPGLLTSAPRAILTSRHHDLIHVHGEVAAAFCLPALAARPSVVTLHGSHLIRRAQGYRRRLAELNLRLLVRTAGRTICVATTEYDELVATIGQAAAARAVVVRNGVELPPLPSRQQRAAVRAELGIPPDRVAAAWVGSLEPIKDPLSAVLAALEATRAGARLTLLVLGEGSLRPELERAAGEAHEREVILLGFRPDVPRLLAAADFYVSSSAREGFSYALLEAMAVGVPPIVSSVPGNLEIAGEVGLAVPYGDIGGFVDAYLQLVRDPDERRRRSRAARLRIDREFGAERMIEQTRNVYDSVLARSAVRGTPVA